MYKNQIIPIVMTSFNTAGLTTNYQVINSSGLTNACCILRITNDSSMSIFVSLDGTNDHEYVVKSEAIQLYSPYLGYNKSSFQKGTKIYIKGSGAGSGSIYLSGYYLSTI